MLSFDLTMNYTYSWANAEKTVLVRNDHACIPAVRGNRDYEKFLSSGAIAEEYEMPLPPAEATPEQKLASTGLSVDELKELLGL
jgi:hypothetical protein